LACRGRNLFIHEKANPPQGGDAKPWVRGQAADCQAAEGWVDVPPVRDLLGASGSLPAFFFPGEEACATFGQSFLHSTQTAGIPACLLSSSPNCGASKEYRPGMRPIRLSNLRMTARCFSYCFPCTLGLPLRRRTGISPGWFNSP